jgi:hypothetical protein
VIQYWIQTPVENAREISQRFIDDNLSAYNGYELTYTVDTEVVRIDLSSTWVYDFNSIYFGDVFVGNTETNLQLGTTDNITTVQTIGDTLKRGKYSYIIFNDVLSYPSELVYFVGYKFTIAAIQPQYSYLLTENSEYIETEDGLNLIQI